MAEMVARDIEANHPQDANRSDRHEARPDCMMPHLDAVLETALYVDDLTRAAHFYADVLGLEPLHRDSRLCAFSVGGRSVLLLFPRGGARETVHMPGGTIPPHDGSGPLHVAFAIARDQLKTWEARLHAN